MTTNVPAGAAMLLDFIGSIEAPRGYDTVYGNNQAKLPKPLTKMTIDQVIAAGSAWSRQFGSSACGKLQFMKATLQRLKKVLGLTGKELLDGPMQDALGYQLLVERGFNKFIAGSISRSTFGQALAQEWASFPVLQPTKGAHRRVARGETYYAGDKLNRALVAPEKIEAWLDQVKAASVATAPAAVPQPSIPATPAAPAAPAVTDPAAAPADQPVTAPAVDKDTVTRVQQQLKDLGYTEVGGVDGKPGDFTASAIRAFRTDNGLPAGDGIDDDLLLALQKAKPRVIPAARAEAPADVVRDKVPEAKANWWTKVTTFFGSIGLTLAAAFNGILGKVDDARGYTEPLMSTFSDIPGWVWFSLFGAVLFGLFLVSRHVETKQVEAFRTGARR